eukprot:748714-Hanusia_phi.AAC.1
MLSRKWTGSSRGMSVRSLLVASTRTTHVRHRACEGRGAGDEGCSEAEEQRKEEVGGWARKD